MVRYNCTLGLVRRLWPVVDGEHYHGEIMRFRLRVEPEAEPQSQPGAALAESPISDYQLELRISGQLLARPHWDSLMVAEVTSHGMAYLRELLQRDGLPLHSPSTFILSEQTDGGAFREGPPYREVTVLAHRPFPVICQHAVPATSTAQDR